MSLLPRLPGIDKSPDSDRVAQLEATVAELEAKAADLQDKKQRLSDEANDYACAIVRLTRQVDETQDALRAEQAARQVEHDHRHRVEDAARQMQAENMRLHAAHAAETAVEADDYWHDPARWRAHIAASHHSGDSAA